MAGFQEVDINRSLEFKGSAAYNQNIKGNPNPEKIMYEWNFQELGLDGSNQYTMQLDTDSTIASGSGGAVMTTASTSGKNVELSCGGVWWYPTKNCEMEIKFEVDVTTTVRINIGFNDQVSEGSGASPFAISGTAITDTATNAVMFTYDVAQSTDYYYAVNTNAGTEAGTLMPSTILPVAGKSAIYRIRLDSSGNAWYYFNGKIVHYKALATATGTPLVPYIGIRNSDAVAHIGTVRYVRCWQDS